MVLNKDEEPDKLTPEQRTRINEIDQLLKNIDDFLFWYKEMKIREGQ